MIVKRLQDLMKHVTFQDSATMRIWTRLEVGAMRDYLYLAWQYLRHHRLTTSILVASITLILYLPAALQSIVTNAEEHFRSRADSTALVIGPRGSSLELVLQSVYFDKPSDEVMRYEQLRRVEKQKMASVIPLHTGFTARECQVVGTTQEYFAARNLRLSSGRRWDMLGECVVGASIADRLGIQLGDKLPVSKSSAFLLSDAPLRLRVVGLLAATETPDDEAIFTDMNTCWIITGLGHGHAKGAKHGSSEATPYTDITKENVGSFHFHGDRGSFPITAMLVAPENKKAETILLGQYFSPEETVQIVRPRQVIDSLLAKVVMVRSYLLAAIALVSLVTLIMVGLVIALSVRLRRSEMVTMWKMGCARHTIVSILGCQIAVVFLAGAALAALMTLVTNHFGPDFVRFLAL
jgi:putative ABC transport system permease protein